MEELQFIGFTPTMREEIDKVWIEPNMWNDGKKAAMAYVPLLEVFMKQYEEGNTKILLFLCAGGRKFVIFLIPS